MVIKLLWSTFCHFLDCQTEQTACWAVKNRRPNLTFGARNSTEKYFTYVCTWYIPTLSLYIRTF